MAVTSRTENTRAERSGTENRSVGTEHAVTLKKIEFKVVGAELEDKVKQGSFEVLSLGSHPPVLSSLKAAYLCELPEAV